MNYPPGMSSRDWAHIEGGQHFPSCPAHEDHWQRGAVCCCDEILADAKEDAALRRYEGDDDEGGAIDE